MLAGAGEFVGAGGELGDVEAAGQVNEGGLDAGDHAADEHLDPGDVRGGHG